MKRLSAPRTGDRSHQGGYALLIMLVMVTMGILLTVVSQLGKVGSEAARAASTQNALKQAKEALIAYAITYRDTHGDESFGYLPCPDTDGDGYSQSSCGGQDVTVLGLLPYRTLGLMEPRDTEGNCLWYAVSGNYKNNPKTAVLNWDTRGKFKVLDQDGGTVLTNPSAAEDPHGGAAAIVFAPGAPLASQTGRGSAAGSACGITAVTGWNHYLEATTFDASGQSSADPLTVTRGKSVNPRETTASTNNDQIAWLSAKEIWTQVRERSDRGNINDLTTAVGAVLENALISDLDDTPIPMTLVPQSATPYTTPTNAYTGKVGELPNLSASLSANLRNYFDNWKEQYRYVACSDLCGYCLTIGGEQCNGALFLGGATASGAPRAAGARTIADLFKDGDGKPLLLATSNTFGGGTAYTGGTADTGICLASKTKTLATALAHCVLPDAVGTPGFTGEVSSGADAIAIDREKHTITLGASSSADTAACVWTPNSFTLNESMYVYFQAKINEAASGITFAVIDAAQNPTSTPCGDPSHPYYLGYAGNGGNPIKPPKIGLEIDTYGPSDTRNDPSYRHMALVYWGSSGSYNDDNSHGTSGDSGFPANRPYGDKPYGVSDNLNAKLSVGRTLYFRMDISRPNSGCTASTCDYAINVWMLSDSDSPSESQLAALRDVTSAYGGGLTWTVRDSFTMNRTYAGVTALQTVRLGFTLGQTSSQEIVISDFISYLPP